MKVYVNRTTRSLALVEKDSALLIRHAQNSNNDTSLASPKCIIEFVKRDTLALESKYQLLSPYECQGCLGLIEIDSEIYVCVITKDVLVARPRASETVNKINSVEFYSVTSDAWDYLTLDANGNAIDYNASFAGSSSMDYRSRSNIGLEHPCASIRKLLSNGSFYYSSDFDVATVLQYRGGSGVSKPSLTLEMADRSFTWNNFMIEGFINFRSRLGDVQRHELDDSRLLTTVIRGFAESKEVRIVGSPKPAILTIISRQSWRRAGTRFNARGVDDDGNVANFVETETILSWEEAIFGFTQIRGSIPIFWEQDANLISAKVNITRSVEAAQPAFNKHFEHLVDKFGIVHIVNLLANKAGEIDLTKRYHEQFRDAKDLRGNLGMTDFDFHAEVARGGYSQASRIIPYLDPAFENINFYSLDPKRSDDKMEQSGIFRTNCLDCLDRTNFVQQLISKYALELFFMMYNINPGQDFWSKHNFIWADNGDQLSQIYAGTNALKSSFTRSGKMNLAGALADVTKSVSRMYINNFVDKGRQNTMDFLLGRTSGQQPVVLFDPINDYVTLELKKRAPEFSSTRNIKVFTGTFNLNSVTSTQDLSNWIFPKNGGTELPDIVLVGFQEIVELTPSQILNAEAGNRAFWEKQVAATLNAKDDYVLVRSEQLVGTALIMFVRSSEVAYISKVEGSTIKTGLGGMTGNKGGVAVSFYFADTSFCFITAHLASGTSNTDERHHNYNTISTGLVFSRGRRINSHDSIVWLGDFNYRIDLPYEVVKDSIEQSDLEYLFENDQLNRQMILGETFPFYNEMQIKFPPTYKFDNGTNIYDTSEKMRVPSWTDRILSKGYNLKQTSYGYVPDVMFSDHRPVYATFTASVTIVDYRIKKRLFKQLYDQRMLEVVNSKNPASLIDLDETALTRGASVSSAKSKRAAGSVDSTKTSFSAPLDVSFDNRRKQVTSDSNSNFVKPPLPPRPGTFSSGDTLQPTPAHAPSQERLLSKSHTMGPVVSSQVTRSKTAHAPPVPRKPVNLASKPLVSSKPPALSSTSGTPNNDITVLKPLSYTPPPEIKSSVVPSIKVSQPAVTESPPLPPPRKSNVANNNRPSPYLTKSNSLSSRSLMDDDEDLSSARGWTPPPIAPPSRTMSTANSLRGSNMSSRASTPKSLMDDEEHSPEEKTTSVANGSGNKAPPGFSVLQPLKPSK